MSIIRQTCYILLDLLSTLIVARCILSFVVRMVSSDFIYKLYGALETITDPVLLPFKKFLGIIPGINSLPVDFSPFLAILVISLLQFLI